MVENQILEKLAKVEKMLGQQIILQKEVLDFDEACQHMRLSKSTMYKLTSQRRVAFYCPEGKKLYFRRDELDQWLMRNRQATQEEIEGQAADYMVKFSQRKTTN